GELGGPVERGRTGDEVVAVLGALEDVREPSRLQVVHHRESSDERGDEHARGEQHEGEAHDDRDREAALIAPPFARRHRLRRRRWWRRNWGRRWRDRKSVV